jgi:hypothetical protein
MIDFSDPNKESSSPDKGSQDKPKAPPPKLPPYEPGDAEIKAIPPKKDRPSEGDKGQSKR